jgi:hypothetical protein
VLNSLGQAVAYKLMPGQNVMLFVPPQASVTKRATFMTKHLWGTPYHPVERYAAGAYPNQHPGGAPVAQCSAAPHAPARPNCSRDGQTRVARLHGWSIRKVSQSSESPLPSPCRNHCARWAELPCVKDSGTT